MPSVLFTNRVYPPATGATGTLLAELAEELAKRGWEVTVVTSAVPGELLSEVINGVRVERVVTLPFEKHQLLRRGLAYAAMYPAYLRRIRSLPAPDVLVTKTDPPMHLLLGPLLRRRERTRLVHWAQDLYPEVAEELGVLRPGGVVANGIRAVSTWALHRYDQVVAIGRCMRQRLSVRGIQAEKISVVSNWAVDTIRSVEHERNSFREAHAEPGQFVVMYSGNMGRAHPFEAIVEAATELECTDPDVRFLFVGEGPRRDWIAQAVAERQLANVELLPFQPKERLSESLSAADLHLVSMHAAVCGLVVPSKIYGVLAAGRPALFIGPPESEAAQVVAGQGCGEVIPAPDGSQLAESIRSWKNDPTRTVEARAAALAYSEGARQRAFDTFDTLLSVEALPQDLEIAPTIATS